MIESLTIRFYGKFCLCDNKTEFEVGYLLIPDTNKISHLTLTCLNCKNTIAQTVETIKLKLEKAL